MDAKPIKTHIRSFRAFRIIGLILTIAGATLLTFFLMHLVFSEVFVATKPSWLAENVIFIQYARLQIWARILISALLIFPSLAFFVGGIVCLAFSTRSKIRDVNRGIDYKKLS